MPMHDRPSARPEWIHEEVLIELPAAEQRLPSVSVVRGALLIASRDQLARSTNAYAAYEAAIPAASVGVLQTCKSSDWVSMDVAIAHYAACDALRLPLSEVRDMGEAVARRIHESPFFPLIRATMIAGATPVTALTQLPKLWTRVFVGGGVELLRTGPKDLLVRAYKNPLFRSAYFRQACAGHVKLAAEIFSTKAYAQMLPQRVPESCSYRIAWA